MSRRKAYAALVASRTEFDAATARATDARELAKGADDQVWDALKNYREALRAYWETAPDTQFAKRKS